MKKIIFLFSLLGLFMCISTTDAAAFVTLKKGEVPSFRENQDFVPPQYQKYKMPKWAEKIAHLSPQIGEEPNLEKMSKAAQLFGFIASFSFFTLFLSPPIVFLALFITFALLATIKASQVLSNKKATEKQKVRARLGLIFTSIIPIIILILLYLSYNSNI